MGITHADQWLLMLVKRGTVDTVQYMTKREKQAIKIERIVLERPELVGSFIYKTLVDPAEGVSSADRGNDPDTNTGDAKFQNLE